MHNIWETQTKDSVGDAILTGFRGELHEMPVEREFIRLFQGGESVLDFGCGVGRNTLALSQKYSTVLGYDNQNMLSLVPTQNKPINSSYTHDWDKIKKLKFTDCCASLCFQHIHTNELLPYLLALSSIIDREIIIHSRTWIDHSCGDLLPKLCRFFKIKSLAFSGDESHFYAVFCK